MKRQIIAMGMVLLMSATTVWAQSTAAKDAEAERIAAQEKVAKQRELERLARQLPTPPRVPAPLITNQSLNFGQNRVTVFANSRSTDPLSSLQVAPGSWWNNPDAVSSLSLTKDQQRKMDDIFQQHRLKLIDLNAALSKEEAILDPLMAAEKLDEPKILTQIDRIAQARAELEKANSRMLLGIRQTLTMEQWTKVQDPSIARWRRR